MSKTLYFECASGISGDMAVAALLDLGAPELNLKETLATLPITETYEIRINRVKKAGLDTCDFDVVLPKNLDTHDHDMAYLYGHLQEKNADPGKVEQEAGTEVHSGQKDHKHVHPGHEKEHEHHAHRGPKEIAAIFDSSAMTTGAKETAHRILDILTDAEAKAHGVARDQVHFHEVGAVDSIVDIAAFAICFDALCRTYAVNDCIVKEITEGCGTVRCQHGILPIPVPAVVNIAAAGGLRLHMTQVAGELVTPTGAAIAAAVKTKDQLPASCQIEAVGLGAGKRVYETAGFLRVFLLDD